MKTIRIGVFATLLGLVIFGLFSSVTMALSIPAKPTDIPIVDQTGTLTDDQKAILAKQISDEREISGNQIAIVIIPSLEGESLEEFSISLARDWGIGTKDNNNGVLMLVVINDKKLRIEIGFGLEGAFTDAQSGRITRNEITPEFTNGNYYEGIHAGLTSIIKAIHGEYTGRVLSGWDKAIDDYLGDIFFYLIIFIFIVISWVGSILGRTKSWWLGGVIGFVLGFMILVASGFGILGIICVITLTILGLLFDKKVSKNYKKRTKSGHKPSWWAGGGFFGGGSSGGGGGGFGGFGGGGFSGGGSSGSW